MNENDIPSIAIVHKAHNLFEEIKNSKYDKGRVEELKEVRELMIRNGFDAPFKALIARTFSEAQEFQGELDAHDLRKQIRHFREIAMLKKGALKRSNIAIGAHLLAESFIKMGYLDVLEFLPFDGNYIDFLAKSGVFGVKIYKKLMDEMDARGRSLPIYLVEVFFNDTIHKIKVKNKQELNERVLREFGPAGKIMNITTGKKDYPIIRSKSIRSGLVSAIVSYVSKEEKDQVKLKQKAIGLLLSPMFKFYLKTSRQERRSNNLYYSLSTKPNKEQIGMFDMLVEIDPELKDASKILEEKFEFEGKIKVESKIIGAAILIKHTKKDKEWVAKYLGMEVQDVERGIEYLEAYGKEGRGGEFLEHIK